MKKVLVVALLASALTACDNSLKTIEERSVDRWVSVINSDYEKAYGYFTPAYRQTETLESYKLRMGKAKLNIEWIKSVFDEKKCDDTVCEVSMTLTYKYTFPRKSLGEIQLDTKITENWIKKDNKWYFLPQKEALL